MPTPTTEQPYTMGEAGRSGHPANHFFQGRDTTGALNSGVALTTAFQLFTFVDNRTGGEFLSAVVSLSNDAGANYIEYSFDDEYQTLATTVDGRLAAGETFTMPVKHSRGVWLRGQAGGEFYRVTAF